MNVTTLFLIQHKKDKHFLGVSIYSNDGGEFCNSTGARFEKVGCTSDNIYVALNRADAERALAENPDWFNSSVTRPEWDGIKPEEYEIKEVSL
jgi:hypothetical protein